MQRTLLRLGLLAVLCLALLVLVEFAYRAFPEKLGVDSVRLEAYREFVCDEEMRGYAPRAYVGFGRHRGTWKTNAEGFIDKEWKVERKPGVTRIACLGGSTTEGGNPDSPRGSFPWQLEELLEANTGAEFDVMNCGVSGWTSAESLVAWCLQIQDFQPDLVVLHNVVNDVEPRNRHDFRSDYTHYRRPLAFPETSAFERFLVRNSNAFAARRMKRGIPNIEQLTTHPVSGPRAADPQGNLPPRTASTYRRNIQTIGELAQVRGADVLLMTLPIRTQPADKDLSYRRGVAEHNEVLRQLAREKGWMLADAEPLPGEGGPLVDEKFLDLVHLTPAGNLEKARLIAGVLEAEWLPLR